MQFTQTRIEPLETCADVRMSRFHGVDFSDRVLEEVDFSGSTFISCRFRRTRLPKCALKSCRFILCGSARRLRKQLLDASVDGLTCILQGTARPAFIAPTLKPCLIPKELLVGSEPGVRTAFQGIVSQLIGNYRSRGLEGPVRSAWLSAAEKQSPVLNESGIYGIYSDACNVFPSLPSEEDLRDLVRFVLDLQVDPRMPGPWVGCRQLIRAPT
jgi:hypothetical protein